VSAKARWLSILQPRPRHSARGSQNRQLGGFGGRWTANLLLPKTDIRLPRGHRCLVLDDVAGFRGYQEELRGMGDIKSLEQLSLVAAFVVPGIVALFVRAQFLTGRAEVTKDAVLTFFTISTVYYGLLAPFLPWLTAQGLAPTQLRHSHNLLAAVKTL